MAASEISRLLFLLGALPFLLLGAAHAWHTPLDVSSRKGLSPRDPGLAAAMAAGGVLLTRHVDVWRAWVGFNFSHSLGAIVFGVAVLLAGRSSAVFAREAAAWLPLAVTVDLVYLALAWRYWFRTPLLGVGLSLASFLASAALWFMGH